jgi:hypothetical protein
MHGIADALNLDHMSRGAPDAIMDAAARLSREAARAFRQSADA